MKIPKVIQIALSVKVRNKVFNPKRLMQEEMKELLQKVNRLYAYESVLFFQLDTNDFVLC